MVSKTEILTVVAKCLLQVDVMHATVLENKGGMNGPDLTGSGGRYSPSRSARANHVSQQGNQ